MVCPVLEKRATKKWSAEYPFEPLYRPWSWILSSLSNLFLLAFLVLVCYMVYKRRRSTKRKTATYRTVQLKKAEDGKVNAVVTGANGTLGKEIVQCLLEDGGYNVHSLDLFLPEEANRNGEVCSYIQTDVTSPDDLLVAFKEADVVFHVAGLVPHIAVSDKDMYQVNVNGTENVIAACKECKVKRLVYTSSIGVMLSKDPKQSLKGADETYPLPEKPLNAYSATKASAEKMVRSANGDSGLLTCCLRPGTVVSPVFIKTVTSTPLYMGDGSHVFPFVPFKATAMAHLLAEQKLREEGKTSIVAGNVYNLTMEDVVTQRECAEFIASEVGRKPESVSFFLTGILAYFNVAVFLLTGSAVISPFLTTKTVEFMKQKNTFSSARAHSELGWEALPPWKEVFKQAMEEDNLTKESKKEK